MSPGVPMPDGADFLLDQLTNEDYLRQTAGIPHAEHDFPRLVSDLVESGELAAVILCTYSLDLAHFTEAFPELSVNKIPTLVLHGDPDVIVNPSNGGLRAQREGCPQSGRTLPPWIRLHFVPTRTKFGFGVFHSKCALLFLNEAEAGIEPEKYKRRRIVDRLLLAIGTGNLVKRRSVDASWMQSFGLKIPGMHYAFDRNEQALNAHFKAVDESVCGAEQTALKIGHKRPVSEFMQHVLPKFGIYINPLCGMGRGLFGAFDFSVMKVELIVTLPGAHWVEPACAATVLAEREEASPPLRIGADAIADALARHLGDLNGVVPGHMDSLFMQPTSISENVTNRMFWTDLVSGYLLDGETWEGLYDDSHQIIASRRPRLSLIWCSQTFIERTTKGDCALPDCHHGGAQRHSVALRALGYEFTIMRSQKPVEQLREGTGSLFMTPKAFLDLGQDVQDCFCEYSGLTEQQSRVAPHIKLYGRLMSSETSELAFREELPKSDDGQTLVELLWLYVGSMCFSLGGQGFKWPSCNASQWMKDNYDPLYPCEPHVRARNFEMGVLFTSRPGRRLFQRPAANVEVSSLPNGAVLLPIPFEVRAPKSYLGSNGQWSSLKVPYMHGGIELTSGVDLRHRLPWSLSASEVHATVSSCSDDQAPADVESTVRLKISKLLGAKKLRENDRPSKKAKTSMRFACDVAEHLSSLHRR